MVLHSKDCPGSVYCFPKRFFIKGLDAIQIDDPDENSFSPQGRISLQSLMDRNSRSNNLGNILVALPRTLFPPMGNSSSIFHSLPVAFKK
jgi:hypothetical protein